MSLNAVRSPVTGGLFYDHDHEEDPATVPAANPRDLPAIDVITQRYGPGKPKESGLNLHVRT